MNAQINGIFFLPLYFITERDEQSNRKITYAISINYRIRVKIEQSLSVY